MQHDVTHPDASMLAALVDAGLVLSEVQDFDRALEHAALRAVQLAQCEGVTIYEAESDCLHGLCSRNLELERRRQVNPFQSFRLKINDQSIAGFVALSKVGLNLADVYDLPGNVPFTFNRQFDQMVNYRSRSMLLVPMCDSQGRLLGVLQLINRTVLGQVTAFPRGIEPYVQALAAQIGLVLRNIRQANDLKRSRIETVKHFIRASEFHDNDTGMHVERMSRYSSLLFEKMGYSAEDCEAMRLGAMLHDVGKIGIPDRVLKKPGKLDAEEWEVMKTHTTIGYEMLIESESPFLQKGAIIALSHHEKWDGSGYPRSLQGKAIPVEGRIVAIADVFDALCSRRVYKASWPLDEVLSTIRESSGSHFDPELVDLFLGNIDEVLQIQQRFTPGGAAPQAPSTQTAADDATEPASLAQPPLAS
jgi:HD-GYP domain-containing protein (c-di-GMP phosphodiesterase class II)